MVPFTAPSLCIARDSTPKLNAIHKRPDVIERYEASGFDLIGGTPGDFGNLIKRETETWTDDRLGLKVD